jgi:membrane dipeptidase
MQKQFLERAKALHQKHPVVDAHFDLAAEVYERRLAGEKDVVERLYLPHFQEAGLNVVVSSVYVGNRDLPERGLHVAMGQIAALREDLESIRDRITVVSSRKKLDEALEQGKVAVLLSMEGLDPIGSDLYLLRAFYDMGVRGAGLTWSRPNALARGCCSAMQFTEISGGLTPLGREAVARMESLGMYLDVSHLNNDGFADVLEIAGNPFIASHSDAWSIHKNYRNLRDDQIEALAKRGGVIGLNACTAIAGTSPQPKERALERLCEQTEYLVWKAGEEHVGFGFDLCNGLSAATPRIHFETQEDDLLAHHGEMVLLSAKLLERGMSEECLVKILGGNFLRYYRSVIK